MLSPEYDIFKFNINKTMFENNYQAFNSQSSPSKWDLKREINSKPDNRYNEGIGYTRNSENPQILYNSNSHNFHIDCVINWFLKKIECPLCRTNFETEFDNWLIKYNHKEFVN